VANVRSSARRVQEGETGLRAQGVRTRNMIVRAATRLLLKSGGLDFTMRAVSREASISVSNLQYYFADRQTLLRAVMAPVVHEYLEDLQGALASSESPREILDRLTLRAFKDAQDASKMSLMWHFATLAMVDAECARLHQEWYGSLVSGIARLLLRLNPDLGTAGSTRLAMMITSLADGLGLQMLAFRALDGLLGHDEVAARFTTADSSQQEKDMISDRLFFDLVIVHLY
jgi:AcrR family transcriptional regulator